MVFAYQCYDELLGREGDFACVIIDHIIVFLTTNFQLTVNVNALGSRKHNNEQLILGPTKSIRALVSFHSLNDLPCEFSSGKCPACRHHQSSWIQVLLFVVAKWKSVFGTQTLRPLEETHEIAVRSFKPEITGCEFGSVRVQLNVNLVELLQILGISLRLNGNVIV